MGFRRLQPGATPASCGRTTWAATPKWVANFTQQEPNANFPAKTIAAQWPIMCHANGDAVAWTWCWRRLPQRAELPGWDPARKRHRTEHSSLLHDEHIAAMAKLGITPSFPMNHVRLWAGDARRHSWSGARRPAGPLRLGRRRPAGQLPLRLLRLAHRAAQLCGHRGGPDHVRRGEVLNPAERVPVAQALKGQQPIDAAWMCHADALAGSLAAGKPPTSFCSATTRWLTRLIRTPYARSPCWQPIPGWRRGALGMSGTGPEPDRKCAGRTAGAVRGTDPLTGFYRDGCCSEQFRRIAGLHTICARWSPPSSSSISARSATICPPRCRCTGFRLVPGDWLTARNWLRAYDDGCAAPVVLAATTNAPDIVPLAALQQHARRRSRTISLKPGRGRSCFRSGTEPLSPAAVLIRWCCFVRARLSPITGSERQSRSPDRQCAGARCARAIALSARD